MNISRNNTLKNTGFSLLSLNFIVFLVLFFTSINTVNAADSTVITPPPQQSGSQTISTDCGVTPSSLLSNTNNYCMLAPVGNLFKNTGLQTGSDSSKTATINLTGGIKPFFAAIYMVGITIAIGLAIVVITFGGIRMATTDSVTATDSGKKMINAAVAGLLIALFSYVILNTINPALRSGSGTTGSADFFPADPTTTK